MDTSKEYVRMCEKAIKIQELWKPKDSDIYSNHNHEDIHLFALRTLTKTELFYAVWLPRQDQLQDMLDMGTASAKLKQFSDFIDRKLQIDIKHSLEIFDKSMEQLWLIFVMYVKHNKTWGGEDWE